jgi:hypothetical protein
LNEVDVGCLPESALHHPRRQGDERRTDERAAAKKVRRHPPDGVGYACRLLDGDVPYDFAPLRRGFSFYGRGGGRCWRPGSAQVRENGDPIGGALSWCSRPQQSTGPGHSLCPKREAGTIPSKRTELTWAPFAPPACRDLGRSVLTWTSRQRLILFLAVDVSDISVLLIAILDEDRTVEVLIGEFVIIFPLG